MRVALGTINIEDVTLKAIRKEAGKSGKASRVETKDYLLEHVNAAIASAGPKAVETPITSPQPAGTLPEPSTDA